jgi:LacI family transcriptional regulator
VIILNKKSGNVTIYDVAEAANVSVSTVSKILNNSEHKFKDETRKLVIDIARELGYEKQDYAVTKETLSVANKIAVIIPDIINPYYASLANGLENSLRSSGMDMVFHNSHNSRELEVNITKQLINDDCIGVIIISICENHEHLEALIDSGIKVVAFEQHVDLDCNKVGFNYSKGGFMATEFLIQNGYKKIGFISAPLVRRSRLQVFDGYKKALTKYDIQLNEKYIKLATTEDRNSDIMYDYQNGIEQVSTMIDQKELPEAIFCINDMTAIGVIRKLQDEGYNVPNDVSVIGFDNINFSYVIRPELTTIEQSTYELGAMAAEILIGSINDSNRGNISIILEPKLIVRESVLIKKD